MMNIQTLNNIQLEKLTAGTFDNFKDGFEATGCALLGMYPKNSYESYPSYSGMILKDEYNLTIYGDTSKIPVGYVNTIKANYENFKSKTTKAAVISSQAAIVGVPTVCVAAPVAVGTVMAVKSIRKYINKNYF